MITLAAWLCTAWVLGAYAYTARTGNPRPFHWANAIGCFGIGASALVAGAWPSLVVTVVFGILGALALLRARAA